MTDIKHILSLPPEQRDDEIRKLLLPEERTNVHGNPADLDWGLAMRMRDEAVAEDIDAWTYATCLVDNIRIAVAMNRNFTEEDLLHVKHEAEWDGISHWFTNFAQPHHYILAALTAKEKKCPK